MPVQELRWNETAHVGPARFARFEVNHWGARMRSDTHRSYNGYLIEAGRYRVLFAGDTAYTDTFRQVRTSKPVDLAIMPIGAYDPWIRAHCNPEQAWRWRTTRARSSCCPCIIGPFELSREPRSEPLERLLAAAGRRRIACASGILGARRTWGSSYGNTAFTGIPSRRGFSENNATASPGCTPSVTWVLVVFETPSVIFFHSIWSPFNI